MPPYLKRSWISPKLASGQSKIHGEGAFAVQNISKGELLMEFGGELVTREQDLPHYRERSVWMIREGAYLALPNTDTEPSLDEHLNHSCDANSWLTDETKVVAKRDIQAGEEITLDQGTWNFEASDYTDGHCVCGAKNCRRMLTAGDWRRPDVQERYRGHFHPLIQKMIESLSNPD